MRLLGLLRLLIIDYRIRNNAITSIIVSGMNTIDKIKPLYLEHSGHCFSFIMTYSFSNKKFKFS